MVRRLPSGGIHETGISPWHQFGHWPVLTFPRGGEGELRGWTRDASGSYRGCQITYQPLRAIASTTTRRVRIDIRDVNGFACSKGPLHQYDCVADFVRYECEEELGAADEDALYAALSHKEIRIIHEDNHSDHLSFYAWDGRVFLSNAGGSHHFAAAQELARDFDQPIMIEAELQETSLNMHAIEHLSRDFEVFAVHDHAYSQCDFMHAMRAFVAPFYWMPVAAQLGAARAILLPRNDKRARRAATVLRAAGFPDLCELLSGVARGQQTIGRRVAELGSSTAPGTITSALRSQIAEYWRSAA